LDEELKLLHQNIDRNSVLCRKVNEIVTKNTNSIDNFKNTVARNLDSHDQLIQKLFQLRHTDQEAFLKISTSVEKL
jgi:hypothetical protein